MAEAKPAIDFWYDIGSTYSYLAAMRMEGAAEAAGVTVRWRPFLLGPIFKSQGWDTSPFNLFPAKGRYMWRDLERLTGELGLPLERPDPFPVHSVLANRVCLAAGEEARPAVTRAIFTAEFGRGEDVSGPEGLRPVIAALGIDADALLEEAVSDGNKARMREETAAAAEAGVFGAPSFVTPSGDLFWGNDRLERALAAARREAAA